MKALFTCAMALFFSVNCMAGEKIKAGFKADKQSGILPLTVLFDGIDETSGVSFNWDFGNGNTSMRKSTTTMFVNPGTYTVKLTVSNGFETDSSFMSINVFQNPDMINILRSEGPSGK